MQVGSAQAAARQNKVFQRAHNGAKLVDQVLQILYVARFQLRQLKALFVFFQKAKV